MWFVRNRKVHVKLDSHRGLTKLCLHSCRALRNTSVDHYHVENVNGDSYPVSSNPNHTCEVRALPKWSPMHSWRLQPFARNTDVLPQRKLVQNMNELRQMCAQRYWRAWCELEGMFVGGVYGTQSGRTAASVQFSNIALGIG
jgi:hypothetical protein